MIPLNSLPFLHLSSKNSRLEIDAGRQSRLTFSVFSALSKRLVFGGMIFFKPSLFQ